MNELNHQSRCFPESAGKVCSWLHCGGGGGVKPQPQALPPLLPEAKLQPELCTKVQAPQAQLGQAR